MEGGRGGGGGKRSEEGKGNASFFFFHQRLFISKVPSKSGTVRTRPFDCVLENPKQHGKPNQSNPVGGT